jgi:hypothetical protein
VVQYGRDVALDGYLVSFEPDLVHARVGTLADDTGDGLRRPARRRLALAVHPRVPLAAPVAPPRRKNAQSVEALGFAVGRRAARYVGEYLPDYPGLLFDHLQPPVLGAGPVAVGEHSRVLPLPERPAHPGLCPLPDVLAVVLCEAGEHLEVEPSRWVGGVYGLCGAPQRYTGLLEPVVGVHDNQQRPAQPIELVDEHSLKLTLPGVLEESPALEPLMQRNGARDAIVGVDLCHLQAVQLAVLLEELSLYVYGFPLSLFLGTHAEVQRNPLRLGALTVRARHRCHLP